MYIFENVIYKDPIKSCALSMKRVNELKSKYEKLNNIKYNLIFLTRMDIIWNIDFNFNLFPSIDKFYVSYWGKTNVDKNYNWNTPYVDNQYGTHDIFFCSSSENMNTFTTLFDQVDKYILDSCYPSHHTIKRYHINKIGLINNIDFIFIIGIDLEKESRCYINNTPIAGLIKNSLNIK